MTGWVNGPQDDGWVNGPQDDGWGGCRLLLWLQMANLPGMQEWPPPWWGPFFIV